MTTFSIYDKNTYKMLQAIAAIEASKTNERLVKLIRNLTEEHRVLLGAAEEKDVLELMHKLFINALHTELRPFHRATLNAKKLA